MTFEPRRAEWVVCKSENVKRDRQVVLGHGSRFHVSRRTGRFAAILLDLLVGGAAAFSFAGVFAFAAVVAGVAAALALAGVHAFAVVLGELGGVAGGAGGGGHAGVVVSVLALTAGGEGGSPGDESGHGRRRERAGYPRVTIHIESFPYRWAFRRQWTRATTGQAWCPGVKLTKSDNYSKQIQRRNWGEKNCTAANVAAVREV